MKIGQAAMSPCWEPKGNETYGFFPLWNPPSSLCSEPTSGNQEDRVPTASARRRMNGMPERCSPARVRSAAPKSGAPLPAPRRSGVLTSRRAAPAGTRPAPRLVYANPWGRCLSRQRPSSKNQQPDISRANKSGHLDVLITWGCAGPGCSGASQISLRLWPLSMRRRR